ncbi:hypothetical protein [Nostoc favosum]|uniref:Uncharacterized protein n=1 Tax=Nostoc favosum CHAB5714 TaxID=2780399 RepID=A0ABS8I240_9NOSO|nr:hypothetical protein [Nostoc favosum]MCC5597961.1 hypothetical protein [Nostoc favosum CHAB5714]
MEIVILLFWLALMSFLLRIAFLVVQTHQETRRRYHPKRTATYRQSKKSTHFFQFKRPSTNRVSNSREWKELLILVQGDTATANRLIDGERRRNPGRSSDWYLDKAIWQLKRDRH